MYGKIEISGNIELVTGMHIGGSSAFAAIGAVDSPVIKDVRSGLPMIPGSSLKGKMRTLLAKEYDKEYLAAKPDDDDERITRLFGSAKKDHVSTARLLFPDMILSNEEELRHSGIESITEVTFENTINRATAVANPRQIERAVRGSVFVMSLLYEVLQVLKKQQRVGIVCLSPASVSTSMAGRSVWDDLDEQGVVVAIYSHADQLQKVAAGLALSP